MNYGDSLLSHQIAWASRVENRLVSASGGHNATLRYDPLGRLYEVAAASGTTRFLYDGDALVAEYDAAGNVTERYAHNEGADVPMAQPPPWALRSRRPSQVSKPIWVASIK
jgi:YD repeat-containing protein